MPCLFIIIMILLIVAINLLTIMFASFHGCLMVLGIPLSNGEPVTNQTSNKLKLPGNVLEENINHNKHTVA